MNARPHAIYFLLTLLAVTTGVAFLIFKPFFYALILAATAAAVANPLFKHMLALSYGKRGVAALITTIIIGFIIVVPLSLLGFQIFKEANMVYIALVGSSGDQGLLGLLGNLVSNLQKAIPALGEYTIDISLYATRALEWLLDNLGSIFGSVVKMAGSAFVFALSLYYMLKDGPSFRKAVVDLSPLADMDDEAIFKRLNRAINAVIRGNLVIALIQGTSTGIGFFLFGVPNAVLWGTVAAITALIPGFGTSLVLIPGIIYLLYINSLIPALGLLLWGSLAVGLVDNILGPKLIGRGMHFHPLLVLLSVLGGLALFGPMGFIIGPLVLNLLFALLEIYFSFVRAGQKS